MYVPNTILELKEPRSEGTPGEDGYHSFPYDEVRVIGASPISGADNGSDKYQGADAQGVLIEPVTSYAGNLDEPFGKLKALYNVKSIPEPTEVEEPKVRIIDAQSAEAGETPEEVFAREAPGKPRDPDAGPKGSPLPEPDEKPGGGPLGEVPEEQE